eukprot:1495266-Pyramimonas_sp.AAC.2
MPHLCRGGGHGGAPRGHPRRPHASGGVACGGALGSAGGGDRGEASPAGNVTECDRMWQWVGRSRPANSRGRLGALMAKWGGHLGVSNHGCRRP